VRNTGHVPEDHLERMDAEMPQRETSG
jgi:hypothetical protein